LRRERRVKTVHMDRSKSDSFQRTCNRSGSYFTHLMNQDEIFIFSVRLVKILDFSKHKELLSFDIRFFHRKRLTSMINSLRMEQPFFFLLSEIPVFDCTIYIEGRSKLNGK
jgi:hypothetical protein